MKLSKKRIQAQRIKTFNEHTGIVSCLLSLQDGRLASASFDGEIKLWDLTQQNSQFTLRGHWGKIKQLIQFTDSTLASSGKDMLIKLWKLTVNQCFMTITTNLFSHMIQLTDTRLVISIEGQIRIWDRKFNGFDYIDAHKQNIIFMLSIIDESIVSIVSVSRDKTLKCWSTTSFNCIWERRVGSGVSCLKQINKGQLAGYSRDRTNILLINLLNGEVVSKVQCNHWIHFLFPISDSAFITTGRNSTLYVFTKSLEHKEIITNMNSGINCFVPLTNNTLVCGNSDRSITIMRIEDKPKEPIL